MPVVLVGIDLAAVLLALVGLGLALALQQGLVKPLAAAIRHAPVGLGHIFGPLATKVEDAGDATVRWLEHFLAYQLREATNLWHGLTGFVRETTGAVEELAREADAALHALRHSVVPHLIHAALAPALRAAHAAEADAKHALKVAEGGEHGVGAKLAHWVSHFTHTVEAPWNAFHTRVWPQAEKDLEYAYHQLLAGEHAAAAELPHLPELSLDEIDKLLGKVPWKTTAGLLAAVPLVRALVRALEREAGLERESCRGKVKNICATDPRLWENLLSALVPLGFAFNLEELYKVAEGLAHELEPLIREAA